MTQKHELVTNYNCCKDCFFGCEVDPIWRLNTVEIFWCQKKEEFMRIYDDSSFCEGYKNK